MEEDVSITIKTQDLLTFTAAAKILGVSRFTLYVWVDKKHQLHPFEIGGVRYLVRTEVESLVRQRDAERGIPHG